MARLFRFRLPFSRNRARADAHDEVALHIEGRIEELVAAGWQRDAALLEALRRFGDPNQVEAEVENIDIATNRRLEFRESVDARLRDLRLAFRAVTRRPTYALAVVFTLALGVGAATTIYTLLNRAIFEPLPYPTPNRLVRFMNQLPRMGTNGTEWDGAYAQYYHYAKAPGVEKVGVYERDAVNLSLNGPGDPWRARMAQITFSMQDLLGARAAQGRLFTEADDVPGAPDLVIVSWNTWQAKFGADKSIVGKTLRINEKPFEVIGVMARGVDLPPERGAPFGLNTDIWVAHKLNPAGPFFNNHTHPLIGRLKADTPIETAQAQVDQLLLTLPENYPRAYRADGVGKEKFWTRLYPLRDFALGDSARTLWIAFAAVILVLLIACANVANLFLVRLETQRHEFTVRAALGANRRDIALEAFAEGVVLTTTGAALGAVLTVVGLRWLTWLAPAGIPRLEGITFGWAAALFIIGVSLAVATAFGLVAAMQFRAGAAKPEDGGRTATVGVARQRVRGMLVATQVAFALMLVVGAGLLFRSFAHLRSVDAGVDPRGVMTVEWFLPRQRYDSAYKTWNFNRSVLEKVRAIPGVAAAGASDVLPLYDDFGCTVQAFDEQAVFDRLREAKISLCAGQGVTTPGLFEALGMKLIAGRFFTDDDNNDPSRGAVIVTKAAAERYWPGENPIGKGISPNGYREGPFYHVVGVVNDVHGLALDGPLAIGIWYPVTTHAKYYWLPNYMRLAVRVKDTDGDAMKLFEQVRRAVAEVDPAIPLANAEPMEAALDRSTARVSFTMLLIGVAGAVALLLAAIGLYGVISYLVVRRTSELGVRLALGAQASQVEALVVRDALRMAAVGVVVGLIGAFAASRVLGGLLFEVKATDPASYAIATGVLLVVAAIAGWIPARRAARVSPVEALRRG